MIITEYVWISDYKLPIIRSKVRVLPELHTLCTDQLLDLELDWSYDGSSTGEASAEKNTEVVLKPVKVYIDPLHESTESVKYYIVLCETYNCDGITPCLNNNRRSTVDILERNKDNKELFGIEQEYFVLPHPYDSKPMIDLMDTYEASGKYYCGVGTKHISHTERVIVDEHIKACAAAGVHIFGTNKEVAPHQWEYQIGTCTGLEVADDLWIARYLIERISEKYGMYVTLHPKPFNSDRYNGSGAHTNVSTDLLRNSTDHTTILGLVEKLERVHSEHMELYGDYNNLRMSGTCETSSFEQFTYGVGSRSSSVRIPTKTWDNKCGYIEDRRPSANMDPYLVVAKIIDTFNRSDE